MLCDHRIIDLVVMQLHQGSELRLCWYSPAFRRVKIQTVLLPRHRFQGTLHIAMTTYGSLSIYYTVFNPMSFAIKSVANSLHCLFVPLSSPRCGRSCFVPCKYSVLSASLAMSWRCLCPYPAVLLAASGDPSACVPR